MLSNAARALRAERCPEGAARWHPVHDNVRGYLAIKWIAGVSQWAISASNPRASQSSDDSGVRLACQKPNPTRTAITKAKTNAAMAAQKAMVPITEKA